MVFNPLTEDPSHVPDRNNKCLIGIKEKDTLKVDTCAPAEKVQGYSPQCKQCTRLVVLPLPVHNSMYLINVIVHNGSERAKEANNDW